MTARSSSEEVMEKADPVVSVQNKNPLPDITSIVSGEVEDAGLYAILSNKGHDIHLSEKVDDAMALAEDANKVEYDEKIDKRILRKIDLMLIPVLAFVYALQYMDKITVSFGAIMGLKTNYNMVGAMYSWLGSGFYLGYLLFVFFTSYMVQKLPPAKTCAAFIIIWGIVNTVNFFTCKTYAGFTALRVLLGAFESVVTPTMVIITSQWWRREEQFLRTCIWFSSTLFGSILGYAIAFGIWEHQDSYSLDAWKICFLVNGLMTVIWGIVFFFYVPDSPAKAWFLSDTEKLQVVQRIRVNNQGFGTKDIKWYQVKECLLDYRIWLIFLFGIVDEVPNGGISNFSSILIKNLGYTTRQSLLLNLPVGAVGWAGCIFLALFYSYGFVKHRTPIGIIALLIAIFGVSLLAFIPSSNTRGQLAGLYIMQVSPLGMITCLSIYSSNVAGHTKKVLGNAIYLIGYCAGNIIGPQTFRSNQAPEYRGAKVAMLVCYCIAVVILIILYIDYHFDNKRRDKAALENGGDHFVKDQEFADLTDRENPQFRYTL